MPMVKIVCLSEKNVGCGFVVCFVRAVRVGMEEVVGRQRGQRDIFESVWDDGVLVEYAVAARNVVL